MTIIEQIKAEIKRRMEELDEQIVDIYDSKAVLRKDELQKLLFFLFDFEKSLPTKIADGEELEKEIERYFPESAFDTGWNYDDMQEVARHFYDLGCRRTAEKFDELEYNRQRAEESVPKDLEEASSKFATHTAPNGVSIEFLEEKLSFQEGAKWQKEQIMKNAKDGWLDEDCVIVLNDGTRVDLQPDYEKKPAFEFEYAQDVRVIVLPKEDGK